MSSLNTKVYKINTSVTETLAIGDHKLVVFDPVTLSNPVIFESLEGLIGIITTGVSTPVANAKVILKPSSGTTVFMANTDASGRYTVTAAPGTGYELYVVKDGFGLYFEGSITVSDKQYTTKDVTITADTELDASDKGILGTFTVTTVGTGIEDAMVTLYSVAEGDVLTEVGYTISNTAGEFAFVGVDPTLNYRVIANSLISNSDQINILSTEFADKEFVSIALDATLIEVTNSSLIQGTTDVTGSPVSPDTIVILYKVGTPDVAVAYTKSTSTGYYAFVVPSADASTDYYAKATSNALNS